MKHAMLAIDVGNTHIKSAVFDGPVIRDVFILSTNQCQQHRTFLDLMPALSLPDTVVISSVRTSITDIMISEFSAKSGTPPLIVDIHTDMGIQNRYQNAATLGIDRLVNAAAAYHLHRISGRPLIVIDMGTATTIDYVDTHGAFMGGAIAPGVISAYTGLRSLAPALPEIGIERAQRAIGRNTQECMRSGIVIGHAAMIREMARLMDADGDPIVIVTGGLSALLEDWFPKDYIIDRDLTLKGLRIIYERNAQPANKLPER
jgi:type III pantothenate kinase